MPDSFHRPSPKLKPIVNDKADSLRLELAANTDAFLKFVQVTYILEGDAVLTFDVSQHVEDLKAHVTLCRSHTALLNTIAVAKEIISINFPAALQSEIHRKVFSLVQELLKKLEPAFEYNIVIFR